MTTGGMLPRLVNFFLPDKSLPVTPIYAKLPKTNLDAWAVQKVDAWAVQKVHGQKKSTWSYGVNHGKKSQLHEDVS